MSAPADGEMPQSAEARVKSPTPIKKNAAASEAIGDAARRYEERTEHDRVRVEHPG